MLRFAILKESNEGPSKLVLEYDEEQIRQRLIARLREQLADKEIVISKFAGLKKTVKREFDLDTVSSCLSIAYTGLINEFKEQSVKIV